MRAYVPNHQLDAWRAVQLQLLADDPNNPKMPPRPLSEWDAHRDGCQVMRKIIAAARAKQDRATDRLLAGRRDAIGELFARAPKKGRVATAAFPLKVAA